MMYSPFAQARKGHILACGCYNKLTKEDTQAIVNTKVKGFFDQFNQIQFPKKTTLIQAGDNPKEIFYIKKGFVRQYTTSVQGDELTIHIFKPGSYFPLSQILNNEGNNYYFETITNSTIIKAPCHLVLEFLKSNPVVLMDVSSRMLKGLSGLSKRVIMLGLANASTRVAVILLYLSRHFGSFHNNHVTINVKFTHEQISCLTSLSRERVSIEMGRLVKSGIIKYESRKITIMDYKTLKTLAVV